MSLRFFFPCSQIRITPIVQDHIQYSRKICPKVKKNYSTKMSLPFQSGDSVKQALFEELQNILSPVKEIRTGAENRMKHLEFTEGESIPYAKLEHF